ncbi:MAG TPA: glycosyltransferase family 1 protein [Dehalococcoidia bacterium]|nr:glycosyltransferase family 1 protein [Dehalococcoidia bacterium]
MSIAEITPGPSTEARALDALERQQALPIVSDLHVALMGRSLRGQFVGVSRYTHQLVEAVADQLTIPPSVFLTRAPDGLNGARIRRIRAPFPTPNEYARAVWEQAVVPSQVHRLAPDVYHSPNYILPLRLRCPSVVTIHDMAFLDRRLHRLRSHLYLSVLATAAVHKATRIICVSEYTKREMVRRFPSSEAKARVIGEGVEPAFVPQSRGAIDRFRRRFGLVDPYILFVGTIEPRKNLPRLIEAFSAAVAGHAYPHRLIIAGGSGWKDEPVRRAYRASAVRERIHFAGYVSDDELPAAYSGADVFVYPSLHEGFGLPPLEAMACGAPVITSNVTSLPEVVGDAAITVNPRDTNDLTDALRRLMANATLRAELSAAGRARAADFSWQDAAARTISVYEEAAG